MASQLNLCLQECFCARSGTDTSRSRIPRRLTPAIEKLQESPRRSMSEAQERSPNLYLKNGRQPSRFHVSKAQECPCWGGAGGGEAKIMMKHIGGGLKINMTHKRSCLRPPPFFLAPPPAPGSCLLIPILYLPNPFSSFMRSLLIARAHEPSFLSPSLHCINCWEPIRTHCNV